MSFEDDRVPCVCSLSDAEQQSVIARAPVWITEHFLAGRCPRHSPLEKFEEQIADALQVMDLKAEADQDQPEEVAHEEGFPVERPYYEVTVRLPLSLYGEAWFNHVADAAGDRAAVSGSVVPELPDRPDNGPSVDEVWRTDAGARLFNGISWMNLVDTDGHPILFSRRRRLTERVIGLLLEEGLQPEDMTPRISEGP